MAFAADLWSVVVSPQWASSPTFDVGVSENIVVVVVVVVVLVLVLPATGFTVPLFFEKRSCRCGGVLISVYFGSTQMTRLFCVLCGRVVRKGLRACVVSYGVLV